MGKDCPEWGLIIFPLPEDSIGQPEAMKTSAARWLASRPDEARAVALVEAVSSQPKAVLALAAEVSRMSRPPEVARCAIVSVRTGMCSEDCAFCAQSSRHPTGVAAHGFLSARAIAAAAKLAKAAGAARLGLVASGRAFRIEDLPAWQGGIAAVRDAGLHCDVSPGLIGVEALRLLRDAGASMLHHNLETARSFFPSICTTHSWEARAETIRGARSLGMAVCAGGLFGLGESWAHRAELALALRALDVGSVPLNFLHPIPGTPMAQRTPVRSQEALLIIALFRLLLPEATIRLCGGRQLSFPDLPSSRQSFHVGGDGVMVGDFLTTAGGGQDLDALAVELVGKTFVEGE